MVGFVDLGFRGDARSGPPKGEHAVFMGVDVWYTG